MAAAWMGLENFMWSGKRPDAKGHILYSCIYMCVHGDRKWIIGCQGWGLLRGDNNGPGLPVG